MILPVESTSDFLSLLAIITTIAKMRMYSVVDWPALLFSVRSKPRLILVIMLSFVINIPSLTEPKNLSL